MGHILSTVSYIFFILVFLQSCVSLSDNGVKDVTTIGEFESSSVLELDDREDTLLEEEDAFIKEEALVEKSIPVDTTGQVIFSYQALRYDTLMLISFKLYGDYSRWREVYALNRDVIGENFDLSHRPILKYKKPFREFILPSGNPYLIKDGDSLSGISKKVYGNWKKWPLIHQNNLDLIHDPNLIFAGFTLYYPRLVNLKLELF